MDHVEPVWKTPIRQVMILVPVEGKTYALTCSASKEQFAEMAPIFEAAIASLQITADSMTALQCFLVGGAVVVVIILLWVIYKKKDPIDEPRDP